MARDTAKYWFDREGDRVRYASPSEVLDACGFTAGLKDIPEDILAAAAERGTRVHDWCEKWALGERAPLPAAHDEQLRCSAYVDWSEEWLDENEFEIWNVETVVHSDELMVAGLVDILLLHRPSGKLAIADIKTGATPYTGRKKMPGSYPIQTALYALCQKEMAGADYLPERYILQLPKDGSYVMHKLEEEEDFEIARCAAKVTRRLINCGELRLS